MGKLNFATHTQDPLLLLRDVGDNNYYTLRKYHFDGEYSLEIILAGIESLVKIKRANSDKELFLR